MKSEKPSKNRFIVCLIIALMVVLIGGVLFVGAVSGWFEDQKVSIDKEYYSDSPNFIELTNKEYENLINAKKSFIIFVDQTGCTTADKLREYLSVYIAKNNFSVYRMMFSDLKTSSLHDYVKYYPSVVIIDKGKIRAFLKADSDDDSNAYNNLDSFNEWINNYLETEKH